MQRTAAVLHSARRILVVAAHPDDEVIGAGILLSRVARKAAVLHVTDGAPRDRRWWGAPELPTREAYAAARRAEVRDAVSLAGVAADRLHVLGFVDQEASVDLAALAGELKRAVTELRPDVVIAHAYEGGHPDHDATAFGVRHACLLLERETGVAPWLVEFTGYHRGPDGGVAFETFLGDDADEDISRVLTPAEQALKQRMVAAHVTQRVTLAGYRPRVERFRLAPRYDFTAPPHPGPLLYERFDWGCTGEEWRARARAAVAALELEVAAS